MSDSPLDVGKDLVQKFIEKEKKKPTTWPFAAKQ